MRMEPLSLDFHSPGACNLSGHWRVFLGVASPIAIRFCLGNSPDTGFLLHSHVGSGLQPPTVTDPSTLLPPEGPPSAVGKPLSEQLITRGPDRNQLLNQCPTQPPANRRLPVQNPRHETPASSSRGQPQSYELNPQPALGSHHTDWTPDRFL